MNGIYEKNRPENCPNNGTVPRSILLSCALRCMVCFGNQRCVEKENSRIRYNVVTAASTSLSGFEPLALRLGGARSILLSYRDLFPGSILVGECYYTISRRRYQHIFLTKKYFKIQHNSGMILLKVTDNSAIIYHVLVCSDLRGFDDVQRRI